MIHRPTRHIWTIKNTESPTNIWNANKYMEISNIQQKADKNIQYQYEGRIAIKIRSMGSIRKGN